MGYKPYLYLYLFVPVFAVLLPGFSIAQVSVTANLTEEQFSPGDRIEVVVSINDPADVYFFSAEILYNTDVLSFISAEHTGLFSDGLSIAEELEQGRIGASVVRTSPLPAEASGDMMRIAFDVNRYTDATGAAIAFEQVELINSLDEEIENIPPDDAQFIVEEAITDVRLTIPASNEVTEGDSFIATADLFASGVTTGSGNEARLSVWVGLSGENSDPATWDESAWQLMDYSGESGSYYQFESDIALQTPIGTYYVAIRSELDSNGELFYGGLGDLWDAVNYPSAVLTISEQPPFRYTLAEWNFDNEILGVSQSLPQNDDAVVEVIGANSPGFAAGASGRAASATGWSGFDPENPKYWLLSLSTAGLNNIQLSSRHSGTSSGPRDFQIQVSTDGIDWTNVSGGLLTITTSFNDAVVENLPLPEFTYDEPEVFIRWLQISDFRIDGDSIVTTGSNRIDDIRITGNNPNSERVEVWAGDTNNDEVVNEEDILPLSAYWNSRGPIPIYPTRAWVAREVENWLPIQATYADANGDGVVNQNDLLPIGLNFGQNRSAGKQLWPEEAISSITLNRLRAGEEASLYILAEEDVQLSGLSFRIHLQDISPNDWTIEYVSGPGWSDAWKSEGRLIEFTTKADGGISSSIAHRGVYKSKTPVNQLAEVKIRALKDWEFRPVAELVRVSVLNGRRVEKLDHVTISNQADGGSTGPVVELPERTLLLQNFPNPFNPTTSIRYTLSSPSEVRVDIYNSAGRKVATLIEASQPAGEYMLPFDATAFSSGVYFYRLQTQNYSKTRSMVLIK